MKKTKAIILVGHGGVPSDFPRELVAELTRLEKTRQAKGISEMSEREIELDTKIRQWPRTEKTDPYQQGVERLATEMRKLVDDTTVHIAYNEFCAPSIEEAVDNLTQEGLNNIMLVTTMVTPGGSHAEIEIPEIVESLQKKHPSVEIRYAWPFDLTRVAEMLVEQADRCVLTTN